MEGGGYLWMWLVDVVNRYIDFLIILLFPTPLVLALSAASLLLYSFLNAFCSCLCYFCAI